MSLRPRLRHCHSGAAAVEMALVAPLLLALLFGSVELGKYFLDQHVVVKGKNRDTAWFSILDSDWPAIRANFERWLDPANFDGDGRQKVSLGELNRSLS